MNILIAYTQSLPVTAYGGSQRVVWWLGKELVHRGHAVTFLAGPSTRSDFAKAIPFDRNKPIEAQIPDGIDIAHLFFNPGMAVEHPHLVTIEGNLNKSCTISPNTVFVSRNHARRHNAEAFVYNGIDFDEYGMPDLKGRRSHFHFLGKAAWRVKNVRGAIRIARRAGEKLEVIGGYRLNFSMGFRFTLDPNVRFHGFIGGERKNRVLNASKGLLFPVTWHEPFGIAIIESLYFGCPVFGTPYGSLPELVPPDLGALSASADELVERVKGADAFDRRRCNEFARDTFPVARMTDDYIALYEKILNGHTVHDRPIQIDRPPVYKNLPFC
jgi:glycosyltransferase involved in cell wall biosynthesis